MKKLFFAAMLILSSSSMFAQEIKSILKAKDYAEAKALVESSLSTLNDEEKAKAYNKLVELSMVKVNKETGIIQENAAMEQMGAKGDKVVDNAGLHNAIALAVADAMECDKYDVLPNAKGKVAPKFRKKNANNLWNNRTYLVIAGQEALQAGDNNTAYKFFSEYVYSGVSPLFTDIDKTAMPDQYLGQVAKTASQLAYQLKDNKSANELIDVAINDPEVKKEAVNIKMALMMQDLKTREDSLQCINTFETLYAKDRANDDVFSNLATLYSGVGQKDKQLKLINERLETMPDNFITLAVKGQMEMYDGKYDEAIADMEKAITIKNDDALVYTWLGFCYNNKAAALQDKAAQKPLVEKACMYLEKARDFDPDQKRGNWRYLLYSVYYNLYGENDARTKELAQ